MLLGRRPTQDDIDMNSGRLVGPLLRELSDMHPGLVSVLIKAMSFDRNYRYQNAREMCDDLRLKGPPSMEVSPLTIDFGKVSGRGHERRVVTLRNRGAQRLEGKARVRHEWLRVGAPGAPEDRDVSFVGDEVPITVTAHPERIKERGQELHANVEILYQMGKVEVACKIMVVPQRATLQVSQPALYLSARVGRRAQARLGLRNVGEEAAKVRCEIKGSAGIAVEPRELHLEPLESSEVLLIADGQHLPKGSYEARLECRAEGGHEALVTITVDVFGGPYDSLRQRWVARREKSQP
jgi:hypothetical protein